MTASSKNVCSGFGKIAFPRGKRIMFAQAKRNLSACVFLSAEVHAAASSHLRCADMQPFPIRLPRMKFVFSRGKGLKTQAE